MATSKSKTTTKTTTKRKQGTKTTKATKIRRPIQTAQNTKGKKA